MRFVIAVSVVVIIFAALIGLWLAENRMALGMEQQATMEWNRYGEPIASFKARFPRTTKNATAVRLEELSVPLGVNLRPLAEKPPPIEDRDPRAVATTQLLNSTNDYLTKELQQPNESIGVPPAELTSFVSTHQNQLRAIERYLNENAMPTWTFNPDDMKTTPLPNLLGYVRMSKLLSAHALVAQTKGRASEAWEAMQALTRLSQSLEPEPVLITQLISIALAKNEAGYARKLAAPVPDWQQEFSRHNFQQQILEGLLGEQLHLSEELGNALEPEPGTHVDATDRWLGTVRAALGRPYFRRCVADTWHVHAQLRRQLKNTNVCDLDAVRLQSEISRGLATWNNPARIAMPNYGSALVRMRDVVVGQEMTSKILQAKTARAAARRWPTAIAGIEKSVCRGRSWNYGVAPDGTMTLAMDKPIVTPKDSFSRILPLSYQGK
jgi:hypothetical protein